MARILINTDEVADGVERAAYVDINIPYDKILLYSPAFRGLNYGSDADEAIKFGRKAGQLEHYAMVDKEHPLLPDLFSAHPDIQIIQETGEAAMAYPCFIHPNSVFKTKQGLLAHMRKDGHDAAAIAEALGGDPSPPPADATDPSVGPDDGSGIHKSPTSNVVQQDAPPPPITRPSFGGA